MTAEVTNGDIPCRERASDAGAGRTGRAIALVMTLVVGGLLFSPVSASAAERSRNLIEMIFGSGDPPPRPVHVAAPVSMPGQMQAPIRKPASAERRKALTPLKASTPKRLAQAEVPPSPTTQTQVEPGAAEAPPAGSLETPKKTDGAETILVAGDFMADALADGLSDAYDESESVVVRSRINGSSGLVREDFYDWTKELGPILDEERPTVLAMMIGSNDRQPIRSGNRTLPLRSDEWTAEYERRVAAIAAIAKSHEVPLVWVGMPSFKFSRMSEDMVFLNDIFRKEMTKSGGDFVDVWDGFVDADDDFIYSGPGVSGQDVRLRNSDGITMTSAGDDKLAFFAQKPIGRLIHSPDDTLELTATQPGAPEGQSSSSGGLADARVTAPVSLSDPALDGGDALLGGASSVAELQPQPTAHDRPKERTQGRADDFRWNEKTKAVAPPGPAIASSGSLDLRTLRSQEGIRPPKEMPGILDAIMDQWASEDDAKKPDGGGNGSLTNAGN